MSKLFPFLSLFFWLPVNTSAGEILGVSKSCVGSDYAIYKETEASSTKFVLANSCRKPGVKAILQLNREGGYDILVNLPENDPGIEHFGISELKGRQYLIYENVVEPTSDEETYYFSVIEVSLKSSRWVGALWSYSQPKLFIENDNAYVGVSVNALGFTDPRAPGWPLAFMLSGSRMTYVPLSEVPNYACAVSTQLAEYNKNQGKGRSPEDSDKVLTSMSDKGKDAAAQLSVFCGQLGSRGDD